MPHTPSPTNVAALLDAGGPFAHQIAGFAPRPPQQAMAAAVAEALAATRHLVVEAGTGIGKTYAYLVPALLSGRRVIVSTGTRHLQDQLYDRDLPLVRRALGVTVQTALLKGRRNYLCQYRLAQTALEGRWPSRDQAAAFARIQAWAGRTRHGDITELGTVAEDAPVWAQVTSTADNCLGQDCPQLATCHLVKARRRAFDADLLVINHHLLFAGLVLEQDGVGELLPAVDAFILDEAHQVPAVASQYFGLSLSSRQLLELARDARLEQVRDAPDFAPLANRARALEWAVAELRLALGERDRRAAWQPVAAETRVADAGTGLVRTLAELQEALQLAAPRGKGLEHCGRRGAELAGRLTQLLQPAATDQVQWLETRGRGFSLNLTPLEVASSFQQCLERHPATWVFTSATLAVGDSFSHFTTSLGLHPVTTRRLDSPFDFARQALLYLPPGLPEPSVPGYTRALMEAVLPVLTASRARAFLLFTSFRALNEAATLLTGRLEYPLLIQGSLAKRELLAQFRSLGNAVLLGTASFWEGVDVRGEALSCVVIDKLPFAAPDDPVLQGRITALRRRGGDPFLDYQVPQAVLALKQGVGRLIRDVGDRGVLVLGDPRLLSRGYGRVFLDSLPPLPRTRDLTEVQRFFAAPTIPLNVDTVP